jgi:putative IMPACT (imprinted ancient) family translation regulator
MLEVLRGHGLSDVVAVVTRYFGGTLLGAGGLVRAYSEAVRMGLEEEGVVRRQRMQLVELLTTPAGAGRLEHDLRSRDVVVRGVSYADPVVVTAAVPVTGVENLRSIVAALTSG